MVRCTNPESTRNPSPRPAPHPMGRGCVSLQPQRTPGPAIRAETLPPGHRDGTSSRCREETRSGLCQPKGLHHISGVERQPQTRDTSPRPSPHRMGRGNHAARLSKRRGGPHLPMRSRQFTLSPAEGKRDEVRGSGGGTNKMRLWPISTGKWAGNNNAVRSPSSTPGTPAPWRLNEPAVESRK
jgi:hypothetical protein